MLLKSKQGKDKFQSHLAGDGGYACVGSTNDFRFATSQRRIEARCQIASDSILLRRQKNATRRANDADSCRITS